MEKSLFMQDSSRSNHGYETMLDYQISWLLRLAKEGKNDRLHEVARNVLFKLIGKKNDSNVIINRVEVWKQWESIDLTAEIELEVNNQTEWHLVVVEDKAYTLLHDNQLARYKDSIKDYYDGKHKQKYNIHYWVITFYEEGSSRWDSLQKDCKKDGWELLSFYEVIGWKEGEFPDTESDLFNEFWLREWY